MTVEATVKDVWFGIVGWRVPTRVYDSQWISYSGMKMVDGAVRVSGDGCALHWACSLEKNDPCLSFAWLSERTIPFPCPHGSKVRHNGSENGLVCEYLAEKVGHVLLRGTILPIRQCYHSCFPVCTTRGHYTPHQQYRNGAHMHLEL